MAVNEQIPIMRSRTNFYASLMRLLNIELEEDISIFDQFMGPITGIKPKFLRKIILNLQWNSKKFTQFSKTEPSIPWTKPKCEWPSLASFAICAESLSLAPKSPIINYSWIGGQFWVGKEKKCNLKKVCPTFSYGGVDEAVGRQFGCDHPDPEADCGIDAQQTVPNDLRYAQLHGSHPLPKCF